MGPRTGLDMCGKSRPPTWIRSPDRPARSQSLYRLSYPAHTLPSANLLEIKLRTLCKRGIAAGSWTEKEMSSINP